MHNTKKMVKQGKIAYVKLPSGQTRIPKSEIDKTLEKRCKNKMHNLRTSKLTKQKEDSQRQIELLEKYAKEHGYEIVEIITNIASGLKENREGLKRLFKLVTNRKVDIVLITFKDRLTRFGFEYLKFFFEQFGVDIISILDEKKSPLEEIIEDFVSLVVSFAERIYGMWSHKVKRIVNSVKRELSDVWRNKDY